MDKIPAPPADNGDVQPMSEAQIVALDGRVRIPTELFVRLPADLQRRLLIRQAMRQLGEAFVPADYQQAPAQVMPDGPSPEEERWAKSRGLSLPGNWRRHGGQ